jgi:hypothetical protein
LGFAKLIDINGLNQSGFIIVIFQCINKYTIVLIVNVTRFLPYPANRCIAAAYQAGCTSQE